MKIPSHFQAACRNPIHHRAIPEHRQIEAMSVEGNKLRKQFADLFDKVAYQLSLGSFADVGRAEGIYAPALRLTARDQRANASDLMKRILRETRTECFSDLALRRIAQIEHPRRCRKIGHRFQIPNND